MDDVGCTCHWSVTSPCIGTGHIVRDTRHGHARPKLFGRNIVQSTEEPLDARRSDAPAYFTNAGSTLPAFTLTQNVKVL
jgi:hypothetical protein